MLQDIDRRSCSHYARLMAKRTSATQSPGTTDVGEGQLKNFAEDLGSLLGHAQNKAEGWLGERTAIAEQLVGVRDTAIRLLTQLGIVDAPSPARRGRKPGSKNRVKAEESPRSPKAGAGRRTTKKRTMSAEAREKIAAARRARWAKQKRATPK